MFDELWKRVDGLFVAIDQLFEKQFKLEMETNYRTAPVDTKKRRKHRIQSTGGHIIIDGDFKSITINGKLVRFAEEKKK